MMESDARGFFIKYAVPAIVALCAILDGCASGGGGGGGGGGGAPPSSGPLTPRVSPDTSFIQSDDLTFDDDRMGFELSAEYTVRYTIVATGERRTDTHLDRINAAAAYARGATGAGETILIMDSGIRSTHREFTEGISTKVTFETETGYNPGNMERYHGTAVTALAAGRKDGGAGMNGLNMHGVAFDADVYFREVNLSDPLPGYNPYELHLDGAAEDQEFADFISPLFSRPEGAVINFSFGRDGAISLYERGLVRNRLARTAAVLAQAGTPDADKKIVVWAAGNAGGRSDLNGVAARFDSPELLSGMSAYFPELQSHVLAVVALDQDGEIADYSNRCGIAKDFCLAAPGSDMLSTNTRNGNDQEYLLGSGTSFAAPMVSGSLALLRQYFRGQLGNTDVVTRLLATANRRGIYADSDIYGHGLVDLDAATRPSGATRVLTGMSLNGPAVAEELSSLAGGAAFGDALVRGLAGHQVAAFDALDAPFFRSLTAYLRTPAATRARIEDRLGALGADPRGSVVWEQPGFFAFRLRVEQTFSGQHVRALSFAQHIGAGQMFLSLHHHPAWRLGLHADGVVEPGMFSDDAFASPYLAFARNGGSAGLEWPLAAGSVRAVAFRGGAQWGERRDPDTSRALGAVLEYRLPKRLHGTPAGLAVQAGWLREPERLMGSRAHGAFGALSGGTGFAGMSAHTRVGPRWSVFAATHLGWSHPQVTGQGLLQDVSPLLSSAFSVGVTGREFWQRHDRVSLRVSQPLRVESGHASLRWVAGRTRHRQVRLQEARLNLQPSARQVDMELAYTLPVSVADPKRSLAGDALNLAALARHHPNHTRAATEFALLFRWQQVF